MEYMYPFRVGPNFAMIMFIELSWDFGFKKVTTLSIMDIFHEENSFLNADLIFKNGSIITLIY